MKQTKGKRKNKQIWQPLCCLSPANASMISLRALKKMNNGKASTEHEKTTRMEILMMCQSESCVDDCEMEW